MRRFVSLFILLPLLGAALYAQGPGTLRVFNVVSDDAPLIRADFYALTASGSFLTDLKTSDFVISEGGVARELVELRCPAPAPAEALSSVLTIDVSWSMSNNGRMAIAQSAARAWVEALTPGASECAISSFDGRAYLNQDFSSDRDALLTAIDALEPQGGTDYDAGLLTPPGGAIEIARRGRHKRIVVFLTDGFSDGSEAAIIAAARAADVTIYCVTIDIRVNALLRNVAEATGGAWFENIRSASEADAVFRIILHDAQTGSGPCEIVWRTEQDCRSERRADITLSRNATAVSDTVSYALPSSALPGLILDPPALRFGGVPPSSFAELTITLSAQEQAVNIRSIRSLHPSFTIVEGGAPPPFTLNPGTEHSLRIRYTAEDSAQVLAKIAIESNACRGDAIWCAAGFPGAARSGRPLTLIAPNGGEQLVVGAESSIDWEGALPTDTVELDYSTDGGDSWLPVSNRAHGLRQRWKVPNTPSRRCLARVRRPDDGAIARIVLPHPAPVKTAVFSPREGWVASGTFGDGLLRIWGIPAGTVLATLDPELGPLIHALAYHPDGGSLAVAGSDGFAKVLDDVSGSERLRFGAGFLLNTLRYSSDGRLLVSATINSVPRSSVWNSVSGAEEIFLPQSSRDAVLSPDAALILSATFPAPTIWERSSGAALRTLPGHTGRINAVAFSPDGTQAATAGADGVIRLWQTASGSFITGLTAGVEINAIDFSPDGRQLLAAYRNGDAAVWDLAAARVQWALRGHRAAINSARFNADGLQAVTAGNDSSAIVWLFNTQPMEADTSDSLFAIIAAEADIAAIDMGRVLVSNAKDSLISFFLRNDSDVPLEIESLSFAGANAADFSIVAGAAPFSLAPRSAYGVEFRFRPGAAGIRQASVLVGTRAEEMRTTIRGEGIQPSLAILGLVDFGVLPVGSVKDTLVRAAIRNIGSAASGLHFLRQGGPDVQQFTLSDTAPFTLDDGAERDLRLRFAAQRQGRTSGRVEVVQSSDGSIAGLVLLFGEGSCRTEEPELTNTLQIVAPELVHIGERFPLDIEFLPAPATDVADLTTFELTLRWNATLLLPQGSTPQGRIDGNDRVITLSGTRAEDSKLLARLDVLAMLGTADTIAIRIESLVWKGSHCAGTTLFGHGRVAISDICRSGGTRLFNPAGGALALGLSVPNPAGNRATVDVTLPERGRTSLRISDMYGREVYLAFDEDVAPGRYTVEFDLTALSTGMYLYTLRTPTASRSQVLHILK